MGVCNNDMGQCTIEYKYSTFKDQMKNDYALQFTLSGDHEEDTPYTITVPEEDVVYEDPTIFTTENWCRIPIYKLDKNFD